MQLREYLNIIRKRWWLAVLVALVAAGVAYGYSLTQPKIYESTVKVVGKPATPNEGLNQFIKTELRRQAATLTSSTGIAAKIDQRGRFDLGPDKILEKIKAQPKPDDSTLIITVSDTDAKRAAAIANAAADIIRDENLDFVASAPDDSKVFFDKTSPAPVPDRPSSPRTSLNTGAGAALGLVLGVIFIFVVEFFDSSLRTEEDVEKFTGLKVLGAVPPWRYNSSHAPKLPANGLSPVNGRVESLLKKAQGEEKPVGPQESRK